MGFISGPDDDAIFRDGRSARHAVIVAVRMPIVVAYKESDWRMIEISDARSVPVQRYGGLAPSANCAQRYDGGKTCPTAAAMLAAEAVVPVEEHAGGVLLFIPLSV